MGNGIYTDVNGKKRNVSMKVLKDGTVVTTGIRPSKIVTPTINVLTDAYDSGDCVGGIIPLEDAVIDGTGVLQSILVLEKTGTLQPDLSILIFDREPTTPEDGAELVLGTDMDDIIAKIDVTSQDYVLLGGIYVANVRGLMEIIEPFTGSDLYAVIVAGESIQFDEITDLMIKFKFMRD